MKPFFRKYLDNNCTDEEFRSFVELFSGPESRQALEENMKEDWEKGSSAETPDLKDTLYRVHYEINRQEKVRSIPIRLMNYLYRAAAILLVPLAVAYWIQLQKQAGEAEVMQTISTPLASKTSFELPDGSKVWLNSGSSISFPKQFSGNARNVSLSGEAYFDVKKGEKPFHVETEHFTIGVLGTAFNVMAYHHEIPAVTLERGKISLETTSRKQETLVPGQQAIVDTTSRAITLKQVDTNIYSSWTRNQLIFKEEPLGAVVKRLERWYNIRIVVADVSLLKIPITANIEFEPIGEVMELMDLTLPVRYVYNKDKRELKIDRK